MKEKGKRRTLSVVCGELFVVEKTAGIGYKGIRDNSWEEG